MRAVEALRRVDARQVAAEEGMALEAALRCYSGAGGNDVATLVTVADLLDRLPALQTLFRAGGVSWAHVRQLAYGARRFRTEQLEALDDWLHTHGQRLGRLDVDARAGVLDDVMRELTPLTTLERQADRHETMDRLVLQLQLDGSSESYATWSPESTAMLADALQAEADAPHVAPCPSPSEPVNSIDADGRHHHRGGAGRTDGDDAAGSGTRGRQLAAALLRLVSRGRAGADGPTPPTRFGVLVDVDRLTDATAGTIQVALKGRAPRIVRRTLDRLACDAAVDAVIRDGIDLLSSHRYRPDVTAATRRAVAARDGGCRWPGCTAPISWCDIHHVVPRAQTAAAGGSSDGDHHPTNLVLLCRTHHTLVHRRGWKQATTSDGTYTLRRRGRTVSSLPRNPGLPPSGPPPPRARPAPTRTSPNPPAHDQPARDRLVPDPTLPF